MEYKEKLIDLLKSDAQVKELYEGQEDLFCSFLIANGTNHLAKIDKPLQERFLRIYLYNITKSYILDIDYGHNELSICEPSERGFVMDYDDTKDFDQQDDEIYKKIFLALNEIINETHG